MRLFRTTGVVAVAVAISSVFGLLRVSVIASEFGTTSDTDAYFFAYDLIARFPELVAGAFAGALIPVYIRSKSEGGSDRLASTAINSYLLVAAALTILLLVAAPLLVAVLGAGFDEVTSSTALTLVRILSPAVVLIGVWGVFKALLQAEGRFFVSTISQVFLSVGIIASTLLLAPSIGIASAPVGVVFASVIQVLWTAYWLRKSGVNYQFILDFKDPAFVRYRRLLGPALIGVFALWLIPLIDKVVASRLPEGTIASLGFAQRPVGILTRLTVESFVITMLPLFSWSAVHDSHADFKVSVERTLRMLLFVVTPLSLLVAVLRVPIIEVLFERGEFASSSTATTANMMAVLVLGLIPMTVGIWASSVFRSLEDTRTPAYYGAGSRLASRAILSPLLGFLLGGIGVALASSLMWVVYAAVLSIVLYRKVGVSPLKPGTSARVLVASLIPAALVYVIVESAIMEAIPLLITGPVLALGTFLVSAKVLRIPEVSTLWGELRGLHPKDPGAVSDSKSTDS